jgi:hypothetical protein
MVANGSPIAREAIERMRPLFAIKAEIHGQPPEARLAIRLPALRNKLLRRVRLLPRHPSPPFAAAGFHDRRSASTGAGHCRCHAFA